MTYEPNYAKLISGSVNNRRKNLHAKRTSKRDALTYSSSVIKPRLTNKSGFRLKFFFPKITIACLTVAFLLGYQPTIGFPPIKQNVSFAQEGISQSDNIEASNLPVIQLPHQGYISTRYSRFHPGVDIAMGLNTPIKPIAEGVVETVNFGFFGYGNNVVIKHPGNLTSLYGHMGKINVKAGDPVTLDTIIGNIGLTGFTSGPHTHLEITLDGRSIDPLTILPAIPDQPTEEFLKPFSGN